MGLPFHNCAISRVSIALGSSRWEGILVEVVTRPFGRSMFGSAVLYSVDRAEMDEADFLER